LPAVLQSLREEFPENPTVKGKEGVKLTPRMEASLFGLGAEFSPASTQAQVVSMTEPTTWLWQVKAAQHGELSLIVTLVGEVTVDGVNGPRTFYSYRQKVDVAVAPAAPVDYKVATASFIENNWKWLATTLVLPAGAMPQPRAWRSAASQPLFAPGGWLGDNQKAPVK